MSECDVAIVGGGAAGLAAAIFAGETAPRGSRIIILDGAPSLGAKILVSGGGRCNVTHQVVSPRDFNGSQNIVRNILAAFDEHKTVAWFESLGITLKREATGKLFPTTDSARTVLNALLGRCSALGIQIHTSSRVTEISRSTTNAFDVIHSRGNVRASRVIACTGGRSLPRSGSDGAGWSMLRTLGHSVTDTFAALVPMILSPPFFNASLSGIALEAELTTLVGGKRVDRRSGSLLWTHFGISGPVVMDASRHWTTLLEQGATPAVHCNVLPGETTETFERSLIDATTSRPRASMLTILTSRLPERVASALLSHARVDASMPIGQLPRDTRRALARAATALELPIEKHRGWNYAEVTAGGVPLREVDFRTMQSRKQEGLYLAGEVLDCDGRIGGFNFQWAWATGYLAGRAAGQAPEPKASLR